MNHKRRHACVVHIETRVLDIGLCDFSEMRYENEMFGFRLPIGDLETVLTKHKVCNSRRFVIIIAFNLSNSYTIS